MSDTKRTQNINEVKKRKDYTAIIIVGILIVSAVLLSFYIFDRNAKVESAKLFENALDKIHEFDDLDNVFSKQDMEKEILGLLDRVIAKYPNTPAGQRAVFYKGYVLFYTENYEKSESNFIYFIEKYKKSYLMPKAYYLLSYCYSENNKNDEAIKVLEEYSSKNKNSYYSPLILYRIAGLYESKNDKEKAISYYNQVVEEFPDSSQRSIAKEKKILLENKIKL